MAFFLWYLLLINLISVVICSFDKTQASVYGSRISEKSLFVLCVLGGSPAMYFTMRIIHHKTRKKKFMIGIPIIIAIQLFLFITVFLKFL